MLRRLSQREILENLALEWEPAIRAAWVEAINRIRSNIVLKRIVERLERGDVAGVVRDLGITDGTFARFENALVQAYHGGGIATVSSMPNVRDPSGGLVQFNWGVRNLAGEQAMRDHAARLVTGIVTEARDGIAAVLTENLARGQSPYEAAKLLAGDYNRRTRLYERGLIGLDRPMIETANRILFGLKDGDRDTMLRYLGISERDLSLPAKALQEKLKAGGLKWRHRQFDGHVLSALRADRGVPAEAVDRIVRGYSSTALRKRGDRIAITETHMALARSKRDAFQQQIDDGKLDAQDVTKKWRRTVSREPRMDHMMMAGKTVGFNELFTLPDGTTCTGPHDPNLPARHTIGCKCAMDISIRFGASELRRFREGNGG